MLDLGLLCFKNYFVITSYTFCLPTRGHDRFWFNKAGTDLVWPAYPPAHFHSFLHDWEFRSILMFFRSITQFTYAITFCVRFGKTPSETFKMIKTARYCKCLSGIRSSKAVVILKRYKTPFDTLSKNMSYRY